MRLIDIHGTVTILRKIKTANFRLSKKKDEKNLTSVITTRAFTTEVITMLFDIKTFVRDSKINLHRFFAWFYSDRPQLIAIFF